MIHYTITPVQPYMSHRSLILIVVSIAYMYYIFVSCYLC